MKYLKSVLALTICFIAYSSFWIDTGRLQTALVPMLNSLVASAHADVFTTVEVEAVNPLIDFDDTDVGAGMPEWSLSGYQNAFFLWDYTNAQSVFSIDQSPNNPFSIGVNSSGNVSFANQAVTIERATQQVGIGLANPSYELDVLAVRPGIRLIDEDDFTKVIFEYNELNFVLKGESFQDIFRVHTNAPVDTFVVDDMGQTGMGTVSPSAALEILRDDGTAKLLVNETSLTPAARTLMELSNPGNTKFSMTNTDAAITWSFANPGSGFRISRQGSGAVEFDLANNGDLEIAGFLTENSDRNAKTNFASINHQDILQKVIDLPIEQWQYKDAVGINHIGPMAQDFYAAFGLGKTDTGIATLDSSGVALAAIQALARENQTLKQQVQQLLENSARQQAILQQVTAQLQQRNDLQYINTTVMVDGKQ